MNARDGAAARRDAWVSAVESGDAGDYAAIVTGDVLWIPPLGDPLHGRAAFKRWLEPLMAGFTYRMVLTATATHEVRGWAWESGEFRSIMAPIDRAPTQEHSGHYFVLWRHEVDDVWRIERYVDLLQP